MTHRAYAFRVKDTSPGLLKKDFANDGWLARVDDDSDIALAFVAETERRCTRNFTQTLRQATTTCARVG